MSKNTTTLTEYTKRYGINATEHTAEMIINDNGTAHVAALTGRYWDRFWISEAITACDIYFRSPIGEGWHRAGSYDAADVRWVLVDAPADNQPISFKRICSRCAKRTEKATGLNLLSEVTPA